MLTADNTKSQKLIDEIRDLQCQAAGKQIELCMLLGDREGAQRAQREMYALIEARQGAAYALAEVHGGSCFFHDQGGRDLPAVMARKAA